jgi:hypothetical protein
MHSPLELLARGLYDVRQRQDMRGAGSSCKRGGLLIGGGQEGAQPRARCLGDTGIYHQVENRRADMAKELPVNVVPTLHHCFQPGGLLHRKEGCCLYDLGPAVSAGGFLDQLPSGPLAPIVPRRPCKAVELGLSHGRGRAVRSFRHYPAYGKNPGIDRPQEFSQLLAQEGYRLAP